jgi:hypothetical protein
LRSSSPNEGITLSFSDGSFSESFSISTVESEIVPRSLDGRELNITEFFEYLRGREVKWDKWEEETYTEQVTMLGTVKSWELVCLEDAVSWPNSDVKHFQELADAGEQVTFTFADGYLHSISVAVKILAVDLDLNLASDTQDPLRRFTLRIQEV